ncbi:MAG: TolB family protein, partial [Thermoanaerobaculia bacterium]
DILDARVSPDGRWLAYSTLNSGRAEVYVQPFAGGGRWQISTDGGRGPLWAHSGRELFYRNGNRMMAVTVAAQPAFTPGPPREIFHGSFLPITSNIGANYDITPDDRQFLMVQPAEHPPTTSLVVVLNWFSELKRLSTR